MGYCIILQNICIFFKILALEDLEQAELTFNDTQNYWTGKI